MQLVLVLWPRFKLVFDMHLSSLRTANPRALWEDDVRPHYVTRRYAEFAASLLHLTIKNGDGQVSVIALLGNFWLLVPFQAFDQSLVCLTGNCAMWFVK
jgi:hypothetical protein